MPQQVCYSRNCACPLLHTQLVEYSKILTICLAETAAGNRVLTVGPVDKIAPAGNTVFQIKGSYEDQELSKYKSLRLKLHVFWKGFRTFAIEGEYITDLVAYVYNRLGNLLHSFAYAEF